MLNGTIPLSKLHLDVVLTKFLEQCNMRIGCVNIDNDQIHAEIDIAHFWRQRIPASGHIVLSNPVIHFHIAGIAVCQVQPMWDLLLRAYDSVHAQVVVTAHKMMQWRARCCRAARWNLDIDSAITDQRAG